MDIEISDYLASFNEQNSSEICIPFFQCPGPQCLEKFYYLLAEDLCHLKEDINIYREGYALYELFSHYTDKHHGCLVHRTEHISAEALLRHFDTCSKEYFLSAQEKPSL